MSGTFSTNSLKYLSMGLSLVQDTLLDQMLEFNWGCFMLINHINIFAIANGILFA